MVMPQEEEREQGVVALSLGGEGPGLQQQETDQLRTMGVAGGELKQGSQKTRPPGTCGYQLIWRKGLFRYH